MDVKAIERRLEAGEKLKIKYRYPRDTEKGTKWGVRSDKLVDVSSELKRFYTTFRGDTPIWLKADEVIEISPDDCQYQDFLEE